MTKETVDDSKVSPPSGKDTGPKKKGFFNRPRKGGKTFWAWMKLIVTLLIPLVVVGATIWFGIQQAQLADMQHQSDQQRALDQQQATILQTYLDNIQDLLLNHNLLKSSPHDAVRILARARTLTALQGLDAKRKGRVLIFLHEADLIGFADNNGKPHGPIIDLTGANLIGADLTHISLTSADLSNVTLTYAFLNDADLNGAVLSGANLTDDDLTGANLTCANLTCANLNNADLTNATLTGATLTGTSLISANLQNATLTGANLQNAILTSANLQSAALTSANLSGASLSNANLKGASGITPEQLAQARTLKGAIMPNGSKHP